MGRELSSHLGRQAFRIRVHWKQSRVRTNLAWRLSFIKGSYLSFICLPVCLAFAGSWYCSLSRQTTVPASQKSCMQHTFGRLLQLPVSSVVAVTTTVNSGSSHPNNLSTVGMPSRLRPQVMNPAFSRFNAKRHPPDSCFMLAWIVPKGPTASLQAWSVSRPHTLAWIRESTYFSSSYRDPSMSWT